MPQATSVRLSPDTSRKLDELSRRTGRSKSFYLRQAIEENIDRLIWQYEVAADWEDIRAGRVATVSLAELNAELGDPGPADMDDLQ